MFAPPDLSTLREQAAGTLTAIANLNGGDTDEAMQACAEATTFADLLAEQMEVAGVLRFGVAFRTAYDTAQRKLRSEAGLA